MGQSEKGIDNLVSDEIPEIWIIMLTVDKKIQNMNWQFWSVDKNEYKITY